MKKHISNFSLLSFSVMVVVMAGCKKQPTACFDGPYFVEVGSPASFVNCSEDGKDYNWSFGDGTSSTAENASKTYANQGIYTVTLQVKNGGTTDEISNMVQAINCGTQNFDASFEYSSGGISSTTVNFTYPTGIDEMS